MDRRSPLLGKAILDLLPFHKRVTAHTAGMASAPSIDDGAEALYSFILSLHGLSGIQMYAGLSDPSWVRYGQPYEKRRVETVMRLAHKKRRHCRPVCSLSARRDFLLPLRYGRLP